MLNEIEKGQLAIATVQCFTRSAGSLSNFPGLIKKVIEEKVWERRIHHGRLIELPSLRSLITERPITGWGQDPRKIEHILRDDPDVLVMYREAMLQGSGTRNDLDNNVTEVKERVTGNSRAYSIDRVKRDAPQFADAVLAGKMSPHAALVEAGIRRKTWTAPCDVDELAKAIERRYPGMALLRLPS